MPPRDSAGSVANSRSWLKLRTASTSIHPGRARNRHRLSWVGHRLCYHRTEIGRRPRAESLFATDSLYRGLIDRSTSVTERLLASSGFMTGNGQGWFSRRSSLSSSPQRMSAVAKSLYAYIKAKTSPVPKTEILGCFPSRTLIRAKASRYCRTDSLDGGSSNLIGVLF